MGLQVLSYDSLSLFYFQSVKVLLNSRRDFMQKIVIVVLYLYIIYHSSRIFIGYVKHS